MKKFCCSKYEYPQQPLCQVTQKKNHHAHCEVACLVLWCRILIQSLTCNALLSKTSMLSPTIYTHTHHRYGAHCLYKKAHIAKQSSNYMNMKRTTWAWRASQPIFPISSTLVGHTQTKLSFTCWSQIIG